MIKTKLILVDGISGSGKSTTSHFIARQLEKNNIKIKWLFEQQKEHPLHIKDFKEIKDEPSSDYSKRVMLVFFELWKNLIDQVRKEDKVCIIESFLFQDVLIFPHFFVDIDKQAIKDYSHQMLEIAQDLNPVIVHLYQKDVNRSMNLTWKRRGENWKKWTVELDGNSPYSKNRNLSGEVGAIRLWQDFTDFTVELFNEYKFDKIQIENSAQDWDQYRKQITDFLQIEYAEDKLKVNSPERLCGTYLGEGYTFKVHKKEDRLYLDAFFPNLILLPLSENEFTVEGYPITFKISESENDDKRIIKMTEVLCYYPAGSEAVEFTPLELSRSEMEKYCGVYWCEADKLEIKILIFDEKLYFYRSEVDQSHLFPISENQFMMMNRINNKLEFKLVDGKWQFTFDVKGEEPSISLFVPKADEFEIETEK